MTAILERSMIGIWRWLMGREQVRTQSAKSAIDRNSHLCSADGKNPFVVTDASGAQRKPILAHGARIYVVGDIHGELKILDGVINKIISDSVRSPTTRIYTVFVGDYIDRGLESRSVIDRIISEPGIGTKIALMGNHEDMMLCALDDVASMKDWCAVGGVQTMFSYGVDVREVMVGRGYEAAQAALAAALPDAHGAWLRGLLLHHEVGDYFFCHAGIDPDRLIIDQTNSDLLWIRQKFTSDKRVYSKIIVHGHSPVEQVDVRHNRINVDTGAFFTGNLACIALDESGIRSLDTK